MKLAGEELCKRARELMAQAGIDTAAAASLIPRISQAAVYKFFSGERRTEFVEEAIRELVAQLERTGGRAARTEVVSIEKGTRDRGRARGKIRARPVYDLTATRKICSSIDFAVEHRAIVLITAEYGVGKTRAVQVWRAQNPDTSSVVVEFHGITEKAKFAFLETVADALGLATSSVTTTPQASRVFTRVIERLREDPTVLIFDQCEAVSIQVLQLIRQIWDRTSDYGVSVVLLSGPPLYERLKFRKVAALGALTSRISAWPVIAGPDRDEVAGVLAAEGYYLEGQGTGDRGQGVAVTEAAFDLWFRGIGGSMRTLLETVDLMSRAKGARIGVKTVQAALGMKTGAAFEAPAPTGWTRDSRGEKATETDAEEVTA